MRRNRSVNKIWLVVPVIIAVCVIGWMKRGALIDAANEAAKTPLPPAVSFEEVKNPPPISVPVPTPPPPPTPAPAPTPAPTPTPTPALPSEINLAVPFIVQAPFANWDETHEETCEEASVYMVALYYKGVKPGATSEQAAEDELQKLVKLQESLFGYFEDTTARETALFAKRQYALTSRLLVDPTLEEIKKELAAGRPVIVPAAGQELGNPYFTPPGPIYHMIVLRGYTKDGFITNDPGTRRGEGFVYSFDTVMNAIHDWNAEDIQKGGRVVIVLEKK